MPAAAAAAAHSVVFCASVTAASPPPPPPPPSSSSSMATAAASRLLSPGLSVSTSFDTGLPTTTTAPPAAAAVNRPPHVVNNHHHHQHLLAAPTKRNSNNNSPSPSPLTPTIEALLWKIDLVDQAGCADLAVIDEEEDNNAMTVTAAAAVHRGGGSAAAAAAAALVVADAVAADPRRDLVVETPKSTISPAAANTEPAAAVAVAVAATAAEAELMGSRRSSDSSTTSCTSSSTTTTTTTTSTSSSDAFTCTALRRETASTLPPPQTQTGKPPLAERRRSRSNSHSELAKTAVGLRQIARKIGRAQLIWDQQPKTVLLVTKIHDEQLVRITHQVAKWLAQEMDLTVLVENRMENDPAFNLIGLRESLLPREDKIRFWDNAFCASAAGAASVDFLITLGGDGTVLYAAWLFQQKCPPIIPFRLGSLGFLTTFDFGTFRKSVSDLVLGPGLQKGLRMNFRMRFSCTVVRHDPSINFNTPAYGGGAHGDTFEILNDLTIDRGPSPFMSQLELYGNENHLTTIHADGLTISTPTGSTAYSLSSGGSLVHPDVSAILVTPICPHTLSFRPMILPDTMEVRIAVPDDSRATAFASFDGRKRVCLGRGDAVVVRAGVWPVPTVCWEDQSKDWFKGLERCLGWNKRERQKGLVGGGETGMDGIVW
ncbi:hypothetical protein HDU86_003377 [Geranomyces michiganensis]|nr:hypothetical protein HDU86_003377 [Geranomyces michiganensis]